MVELLFQPRLPILIREAGGHENVSPGGLGKRDLSLDD